MNDAVEDDKEFAEADEAIEATERDHLQRMYTSSGPITANTSLVILIL